jgi:hypothetical protein
MGLTKATAPKTPRIKWHARQAPVRHAEQADLFEAMA